MSRRVPGVVLLGVALLLAAAPFYAQRRRERPAPPAPPAEAAKPEAAKPVAAQPEAAKPEKEKPPIVTHHQIHVDGRTLSYTATTGMLPINNAQGVTEAHIFFVAYTLDNAAEAARRPLMFSFNGGPGSSSVWLHMGAIGPRRVALQPNGSMPAPPFHLTDNAYTWLDQTDLVFIDPVGTGYSRPVKPELGKKFWGVHGDIESVGEFIRLYLTRYKRWTSPLFLVGESYGTTRAAGLSGYLVDHGMALNGIVLISSVLNFETLEFNRGNDLPYILYLPSYTAIAWYHKKLPADLQGDMDKAIAESKAWAETGYATALAKGDRLTPAERQDAIDHLARYTGLSREYIDESNLRIRAGRFRAELLRSQKLILGRLDARFTGLNYSGVAEVPDYDPSEAAIRPPYTALFNNYVRADLGYETDREYYILGGGFRQWDWGSAGGGFPNTAIALREAFVKNPYMKLYVASGHFDLATPFFATEYTLHHLNLDAQRAANISTGYYDAGHMIYIREKSLAQLKQNVSQFISSAIP